MTTTEDDEQLVLQTNWRFCKWNESRGICCAVVGWHQSSFQAQRYTVYVRSWCTPLVYRRKCTRTCVLRWRSRRNLLSWGACRSRSEWVYVSEKGVSAEDAPQLSCGVLADHACSTRHSRSLTLTFALSLSRCRLVPNSFCACKCSVSSVHKRVIAKTEALGFWVS